MSPPPRRHVLATLLLVTLGASTTARAQAKIEWREIAPAAARATLDVDGAPVVLLRFALTAYRARVLVGGAAQTAAEAARAPDVAAAVNGGFFDEHRAPLGLRVADGVVRAPLRPHADWGVLLIDDRAAHIVHTTAVHGAVPAREAIQVLEALAKNPLPSAHEAFLSLAEDASFNAHEERTLAVVRAGVHIRPAPARLVAFWDRYCQPEDGFTPTTVTILIENGSAPALALFARKMEDPAHGDDDKIAWMRTRILCHRNDVGLLETCERLLVGTMPERLLPSLVEVLFDYRPEDWFRPTTRATVPPLESASREALDAVIRVAIVALTMVELRDEQRLVVKERMRAAELLRQRWGP